MINSIGLVGLAESFTGLSGEPPYLVERFELTSFPSGSGLQTKTSPPPRVPLNLNLHFRHRLRGIIPILRQIARPRERLPRKSQRLWKYRRVIRYVLASSASSRALQINSSDTYPSFFAYGLVTPRALCRPCPGEREGRATAWFGQAKRARRDRQRSPKASRRWC